MSWRPADDPNCADRPACAALDLQIVPRTQELGGLEVRRALPTARRRMVGPFIFFDQMGPAEFLTGDGLDVAPHPHIGLATITYLFHGEILHRDSVGSVQAIHPGDVNWMTAGSGIVHSERTTETARQGQNRLFGLQCWVALPESAQEIPPSFAHHGKDTLPLITDTGTQVRVIAGTLYGETSPVATHSEMFYADAELTAGSQLPLPATHEERAVYVTRGTIDIAGDVFPAGQLLIFRPGDEITIKAMTPSRLMLLGGAALPEKRHIWWNFVSTSKDRIEQAKEDWREGRFAQVPGETDFYPLPD